MTDDRGQIQSFKLENASEISQKTWNLEHGTLKYIEQTAASFLLPAKLPLPVK